MRIITRDDFTETYAKVVQRGTGFLTSKFRVRGSHRTLSAFNHTAKIASNWYQVPSVRQRWNRLITGDENTIYEDYVVKKYLGGKLDLNLLSIGSGSCSHEINFAMHNCFSRVTCVDMAGNLLEKGKKRSRELDLKNMEFVQGDAYHLDLKENDYDMILFHASLHHFQNIQGLIGGDLLKALKGEGILVINEYVGSNRFQFPGEQISMVNQALQKIPRQYRIRYRMKLQKNRVSGAGILRMYMADPSEAPESDKILEILNRQMEAIEIKPYGGNILMLTLKDISHHFMEETLESDAILKELFDLEDKYMEKTDSDFVFGVYRKRK